MRPRDDSRLNRESNEEYLIVNSVTILLYTIYDIRTLCALSVCLYVRSYLSPIEIEKQPWRNNRGEIIARVRKPTQGNYRPCTPQVCFCSVIIIHASYARSTRIDRTLGAPEKFPRNFARKMCIFLPRNSPHNDERRCEKGKGKGNTTGELIERCLQNRWVGCGRKILVNDEVSLGSLDAVLLGTSR